MSETLVERAAREMYWDRVNPNMGAVTLGVAVAPWEALEEEHRGGLQVWHCKAFWRSAALAVLRAIREPTNEMVRACAKAMSPDRRPVPGRVSVKNKHRIRYRAMIDAAIAEAEGRSSA